MSVTHFQHTALYHLLEPLNYDYYYFLSQVIEKLFFSFLCTITWITKKHKYTYQKEEDRKDETKAY